MHVTRVTYTIKPEFVEQNKTNIRAVMAAVRTSDHPGLKYSTFDLGNGRFLHLAVFADEASRAVLGATAAFKHFQAGLRQNLMSAPEAIDAELVGSTFDWF